MKIRNITSSNEAHVSQTQNNENKNKQGVGPAYEALALRRQVGNAVRINYKQVIDMYCGLKNVKRVEIVHFNFDFKGLQ
jgi:hypothetical protein